MKTTLKVISMMLTVLLVFGLFSVATPVVAADIQEKEATQENLQNIVSEISENNNQKYTEIVSERDRFTKVFSDETGALTAVVSTSPIHYEKNKEWVDIDNTLVSSKDSLINKSNSFSVALPDELGVSESIELKNSDYSISFTLQGTDLFENNKKVTAQKKKKPSKNENNSKNKINTDFLNKNVAVSYSEVGENTDIEYTVTSTGIKENIVLNKKPKSEVEYIYSIKAEGLTAEKNDDNSVSFLNDTGEIIFNIPAPVMFDDKSQFSTDILVTLSGGNGLYEMKYIPSFEWLKKVAKYPVIIDPVIEYNQTNAYISDTYASNEYPNDNQGTYPYLLVGTADGYEYVSYITMDYDVLMERYGVNVKNVSLVVPVNTSVSEPSRDYVIGAYPIIDWWGETTLTYTNKPTLSNLIDKKTIYSFENSPTLYFDVTKAYTPGSNYCGIALKHSDPSLGNAMAFIGSKEGVSYYEPTYFIVEYYETRGVEEQFDYHTQDLGRAGTVYINDFSNLLFVEREDIGLPGNVMPVTIKSYLQSSYGGTYSFLPAYETRDYPHFGVGWLTNFNQCLEYYPNADGKETIIYMSGDGQAVYFQSSGETTDGKAVWNEKADKFSSKKGYTLYIPTQNLSNITGNWASVTVKGPDGNTYEFNQFGFLSRIVSGDENFPGAITVSYMDNRCVMLDKIIDGVGREFRFSYNNYYCLDSINVYNADGTPVTVNDNNGNTVNYKISYGYTFVPIQEFGGHNYHTLSSITYPDGEKVYYNYGDYYFSMHNVDGRSFICNRTSTGAFEYYETAVDSNGQTVMGAKMTVVNDNAYQKTFTDSNNVTVTKQFDLYGRVTNTINSDGTHSLRTYSEENNALGQISSSMYNSYEYPTTHTETNLISNSSFNQNTSDWVLSDWATIGSGSDRIVNNSNPGALAVFSGINYASQVIPFNNGKSGDEFQLDFYSYMINMNSNFDTACLPLVYVEARNNVNGNETWQTVGYVEMCPYNTNWQGYSLRFDIDFDYNEIKITLVNYLTYGTVMFDDVELYNTYKVPLNTDTSTGDSSSGTGGDETKCTCNGCEKLDCPCRECSDNCTRVCCKQYYAYDMNSNGWWFVINNGDQHLGMCQNVYGNYYGESWDINGLYTWNNYNQSNGQLVSSTKGYTVTTNYTYDAMSRLNGVKNVVSNLSNGSEMATTYLYEKDRIKSVTHNGFSYNYEYDAWGNPTAVKVGEQPLVSYSYDSGQNRSRVNRITYGNGDYTDYSYSTDGNISVIKSYSADNTLNAEYQYTYNSSGILSKIYDALQNTETRYTDGKTEIYILNGSGEADDELLYSTEIGDNEETVEFFGGNVYTQNRGIPSENAETGETTTKSTYSSEYRTFSFESTTDYYGRLISRYSEDTFVEEPGWNAKMYQNTEYGYLSLSETETSTLVNSYKTEIGARLDIFDESLVEEIPEETVTVMENIEYLYDYNLLKNITRVRKVENGVASTLYSYVYDEAEQIVRENNFELGKTYVYVYDIGGNIVQKIEYDVTEDSLGTPLSTINYGYDTVWKDKLVSYNGTAITSDAMGNPLNAVSLNAIGGLENLELEWNGRQLSAVTRNTQRYEYSYDSNGMRTEIREYKNGSLETVCHYAWQNGKLVGLDIRDGSGEVRFVVKMIYDNAGESTGYIIFDEENSKQDVMHFQKNLQGDITGVFCEGYGREVLTYKYDAWGNITPQFTVDGLTMLYWAEIALLLTPITYRGYMYDPYIGMYYLQSRYYNPAYGRFLNVDDTDILEASQGTTHGANLFAYCNNNPVMNVDCYGDFAISAVLKVVIKVIGIIMFLWTILKSIKIVIEFLTAFLNHSINVANVGAGVGVTEDYPYYEESDISTQNYAYYCLDIYNGTYTYTGAKLYTDGLSWEEMSSEKRFDMFRSMSVWDPGMFNFLIIYYVPTWLQSVVKVFVSGMKKGAGYYGK